MRRLRRHDDDGDVDDDGGGDDDDDASVLLARGLLPCPAPPECNQSWMIRPQIWPPCGVHQACAHDAAFYRLW